MDEVLSVLRGLAGKWEEVGELLDIPETTLRATKSENTEDVNRLQMCIIYWLQRDPEASWRRLIFRLDCSYDEDMRRTTDAITKYAEKLSGQSMSHGG